MFYNIKSSEKRGAQWWGRLRRPPHWVCVLCFCSFIFLYSEYLWIFLIYSLCILCKYVLNVFHLFSFMCFVIYSVNSSSGHDRSQTFVSISHAVGPKLTFWGNSIMVQHGFAWRSSKNLQRRIIKKTRI